MTGRLDRDVVLACLNPRDVLAHFRVEGKARGGSEFATGICPTCGPRKRNDGVCVNLSSGRWHCKVHGCAGSMLDLIAGFSGLTLPGDLDAAIRIAAEIAGVGPEVDPRRTAALAAQRKAEEERLRAKKALERIRGIEKAAAVWRDALRHSVVGEKYLVEQRGLDAAALIRQDCVRFHPYGHPCVALRSSEGQVLNVVRRSIDAGRKYTGSNGEVREVPKTPGLLGCPTAGTLVGSLEHGVIQFVVVTEGVLDTLTACLAWPNAQALGAHGAGEFAKVAGFAARLMARLARPRVLTLVGHNDPAQANGRRGAGPAALEEAIRLARAAGLEDQDVVAPRLDGHNDLNLAWTKGWQP